MTIEVDRANKCLCLLSVAEHPPDQDDARGDRNAGTGGVPLRLAPFLQVAACPDN